MDRRALLSQILRWSEKAGLTAKEIENPSVDFHVVVSEPRLPSIEILHQEPDSEFILFAARTVPPENIQQQILELDPKQRNELVSDIRLRLLSTNLEFKIIGAESGVPSSYELYSKFFFKSNTIQNFWQTYVQMKSAVIMITTLHRNRLDFSV